jgi:hypothetical protein
MSPDNPFDRGDFDIVPIVVSPEENVIDQGVRKCYQPVTSPVSSVETCKDKVLPSFRIQRYWTRSQARRIKKGKQVPARVAMIRPAQMRQGRQVVIRRRYDPRSFIIRVNAPVIQTNSVISRVTLPDGTMAEENLNGCIFMARTVHTQTVIGGGILPRPVCNFSAMTVINISSEMAEYGRDSVSE